MTFPDSVMNTKMVLFAGLIAAMILPFTMIDFADAEFQSPLKQIKNGVALNDVQCNDNKVLAAISDVRVVCVNESTAEKKGWNVIATEFKVQPVIDESIDKIPESITPTKIILDQSSDVEFVDDGRVIDYSTSAGGGGSPRDAYQYVIGKWIKHSEFQNDGEGNITLTSVPHEKYSLKPNKTFYLEDWLPEYLPDGYYLLYSQTDVSSAGEVSVIHQYVPTIFVLTEYTNSADLLKSKGFVVSAVRLPYEMASVEDRIEHSQENHDRFGGHYGPGFMDMYRDGKLIYAYSGGTTHHFYQSALSMNLDKYTSFIVSTNYLTIDEILPIFNSVGN